MLEKPKKKRVLFLAKSRKSMAERMPSITERVMGCPELLWLNAAIASPDYEVRIKFTDEEPRHRTHSSKPEIFVDEAESL